MFRIKICGITTVADALAAAEAGADALGLNFYPRSPRYVEPQVARKIVEALPAGVIKVGLFVNARPGEIRPLWEQLGLDLIQLHGDEPPELLAALSDCRVMRAFRVGAEGLNPVVDYLQRCRRLNCLPGMILADSAVKGTYGGSGQVGPWQILARRPADLPPLVLAGGLTPDNVAHAIAAVQPAAVDTASGVEDAPGHKSSDRIRSFVRSARQAFDSPLGASPITS